jgi:hypothetical protein
MNVNEARSIARRWVEEQASQIPGFMGAFFAGSTNEMDGDAPMPATSDVDVVILVDGDARHISRLDEDGLVVEVSTLPASRILQPADVVLSDFRYACHFARPTVIADPSGRLAQLQEEVSAEYGRRVWVEKRCEMLRKRLVDDFLGHSEWAHLLAHPDEVWGPPARLHYALLLAAQIPAVADLRSPTVRRSLVVCGQVLADAGRSDVQESLLDCMGVAAASHEQTSAHLQACSRAFDRAVEVFQTPFFFSSMINADSRSMVVAGAQQILDMGLPGETLWWIHFVHDWVQEALQNDAPPAEKAQFAEEYLALLAEIGQGSPQACEERESMLADLAPEIMNVAETIMDRNPSIWA